MSDNMTSAEYDLWWSRIDGESVDHSLPEPDRTLILHVLALQDRIDRLPDPDVHDKAHGRGCRCYAVQCACAYDHPEAVCMIHAKVDR